MFKKVIAIAMAAAMVFSIAPTNNVTVADAATPTTAAPSDLSKIDVEPVLKYTFDDATGIELKGTAKVENGCLVIPPNPADEDGLENGYGQNYAKIGSLADYDFSKGFSWTADISVDEFTYDWTSPIMLGNGTIGVGTAKDEVGYHFTEGLSNIMDYGKDASGTNNKKYGVYGGGQVANPDAYSSSDDVYADWAPLGAPYTYEWFADSSNCGKWYTFTVTISPQNELVMYINGVPIQTCTDDGFDSCKKILDNVNKFTNNLLGATYWGPLGSDIDFKGSFDNVAFYNTVLTAEQAKNLTSAEAEDENKVVNVDTVAQTPKSQYKTAAILDTDVTCGKKKIEVLLGATASKVNKSTVTVNGKAAKSLKFSGKSIIATLSKKLKKGDKVVITIAGDGYTKFSKTITVKGIFKLTKVKVKKGATSITGKVNAKKATVKVKVGKKGFKKAKVKGKKFTFKTAALKKGTKVKIKVTKSGFTSKTKTYKVK